MGQCTATAKRTGERCRAAAMRGQAVCRMHGGKSLRGQASALYKHGRYSKDLPARLVARYEAAEVDDDLLVQRAEIAVLEARLAELIEGLDRGETGRLWAELRAHQQAADEAQRANDLPAMAEHLNAMRQLVQQGAAEADRWREVRSLIQDRRRLVESERKRLVDLQQMITTKQALILAGALVAAVQDAAGKRVGDAKQRRLLLNDVTVAFAAITGATAEQNEASRRGGNNAYDDSPRL